MCLNGNNIFTLQINKVKTKIKVDVIKYEERSLNKQWITYNTKYNHVYLSVRLKLTISVPRNRLSLASWDRFELFFRVWETPFTKKWDILCQPQCALRMGGYTHSSWGECSRCQRRIRKYYYLWWKIFKRFYRYSLSKNRWFTNLLLISTEKLYYGKNYLCITFWENFDDIIVGC